MSKQLKLTLAIFLGMFLFLALLVKPQLSEAASTPPVSFRKEIYPIFRKKCNMEDCHGRKGMPNFMFFRNVKKKSKEIVKRINDKREPMPPKNSRIKLEQREINLITKWVESGAPDN